MDNNNVDSYGQPLMPPQGQPVQQQQVPQAQVSYGGQQQQQYDQNYQQQPQMGAPQQQYQQQQQQQPYAYPTGQNPDVPQAEVTITEQTGKVEGYHGDTHDLQFHDVFQKHSDRNNFIKKVYLIVLAQMMVTVGFTCMCMKVESIRSWIYYDGWILAIPACILAITCQIAIICCKTVRRQVPHNYIILFIFTLCFSYFVAQECIYWGNQNQDTIYIAAICTGAVTGAVTLYAFTTSIDFNVMRGMMFVFSMAFLMFFMMSLCFGFWMTSFYAAIMCCFYGLFLLCDTQLVIKKGRHGLSVDDYITGAMLIYSDIIMIFLYMLTLFGGRR